MKIILQSFLRALCAIAVGALLIEYRQEMVQWMTITIGVLFFLSGVIAVTMAYASKRIQKKMLAEAENMADDATEGGYVRPKTSRGWYCGMAAGIGSMLLGMTLALMPETFVEFLVYVLSAMLIIGAIQQYSSLFIASRISRISLAYWVMPTLLLLAGIVAVAYPSAIASSPLFFIGWCMIIYGVVECINGIKEYSCSKKASKTMTFNGNNGGKPDFSDAEEVDYEEIKK